VGRRLVTATVSAAVVAASCAGCFSDNKPTEKSARITVDDRSQTSHAISCSQVQFLLTANIKADPGNVRLLLKLDSDKPKIESVHIDNFQGFTGVADSGAGDASVAAANGRFTVTGNAQGSRIDDPRISLTAPFKIEVGC
jgi:ipoprotein LpqH